MDDADPLNICMATDLQAGFQNQLGNGILNPQSEQCQRYMAQYCAKKWDGYCEYLSNSTERTVPNALLMNGTNPQSIHGAGSLLSRGQILLRNTAMEKYRIAMSENSRLVYEPFDPTTSSSPLMAKWIPTNGRPCIPVYGVNPDEIDSDPVMDRILIQPYIAIDILINIYVNMKKYDTLDQLQNTKLGRFFGTRAFQDAYRASLA
jgi:hypothetical protein